MIKVSIIVPVYNTDSVYLSKCIHSVLNQSFTDFELLLIDDNSKEETKLQLSEFQKKDPRIRVITHNQNKGISCTRNEGIELSVGEWICFLDHDDYWKKDYLQHMVEKAEEGINVCVCGFQAINEDKTINHRFPEKEQFFESQYFQYASSAPWNRLIRRTFLEKHNIKFPEGCLTEDIAFNIQCNIMAGEVNIVKQREYINRIANNSTSRSDKFCNMTAEKMPFNQINKIINILDSNSDIAQKNIAYGAIYELCTILSCLFSRKASRTDKEKIREELINTVTKIKNKAMTINTRYIWNVPSKLSVKVLQIGLCIAIKLHLTKVYIWTVHTVINRLYK